MYKNTRKKEKINLDSVLFDYSWSEFYEPCLCRSRQIKRKNVSSTNLHNHVDASTLALESELSDEWIEVFMLNCVVWMLRKTNGSMPEKCCIGKGNKTSCSSSKLPRSDSRTCGLMFTVIQLIGSHTSWKGLVWMFGLYRLHIWGFWVELKLVSNELRLASFEWVVQTNV